jgi:D-mannonate dehydratase
MLANVLIESFMLMDIKLGHQERNHQVKNLASKNQVKNLANINCYTVCYLWLWCSVVKRIYIRRLKH